MRFIVLIFGFIGIILTGFMGMMSLVFTEFVKDLQKQEMRSLHELGELLEQSPHVGSHEEAAIFLFIAAVYGLIGSILAFTRCGWQGSLLILVPIVGAAALEPVSLAFTGLQAVAGILSFLVFPLPLNAPPEEVEDEESEDEEEDEEEEEGEDDNEETTEEEPEEEEAKPAPKKKPKAKSKDDDED